MEGTGWGSDGRGQWGRRMGAWERVRRPEAVGLSLWSTARSPHLSLLGITQLLASQGHPLG